MQTLIIIMGKSIVEHMQDNARPIAVVVIALVFVCSFLKIKNFCFKSLALRLLIAVSVIIFLFSVLFGVSVVTSRFSAVEYFDACDLVYDRVQEGKCLFLKSEHPLGALPEAVRRHPDLNMIDISCAIPPWEMHYLNQLEELEDLSISRVNCINYSALLLNLGGLDFDLRPEFIEKTRLLRSSELPDFRNFKNLKRIKLSCEFKDTSFFDHLKEINVEEASFNLSVMNIEGVKKLFQLKSLKVLDLDEVDLFGDANVVIPESQSIKKLCFGVENISVHLVVNLVESAPNLEFLGLAYVKIESIDFREGLCFKHLTNLDVAFSKISLEALESILRVAPLLNKNNVAIFGSNVTSKELEGLFKKMNRE